MTLENKKGNNKYDRLFNDFNAQHKARSDRGLSKVHY